MAGFNTPPGCSVSSIPGNRPEDADFENACQMATVIIQASVPQLLHREGMEIRHGREVWVVRPGLLSDDQADKLVDAIANALITAFDNGKEAGIIDGKHEARMEAAETD